MENKYFRETPGPFYSEMEAAGIGHHVDQDMDPEALPFLPDDVLLQVFEYLTLPELFAARVVCRRWADLALHPAVWRHRELSGTGRGQKPKKGLLRAALALAPCARSLRLHEPTLSIFDDGGVLVDLAVKTRCGVESLDVLVENGHVEEAARILENQATLGRTRKLCLSIHHGYSSGAPTSEMCRDLVASLCALEDLTELRLKIEIDVVEGFDLAWMPELDASRKSTLRTLSCDFTDPTWAVFMGRLMEWHAATLESVGLSGTYEWGWFATNLSCLSDSLANTTRLRELDCPMQDNMAESLLQCTELETLTLKFYSVFRRGSSECREARKYLQEAKGLRALTLWGFATNMDVDDVATDESAVELVEALTHSNQPTLEVLECRLGGFHRDNLELVDRLSAVVLGHLPALRLLTVYPIDYDAAARLLDRLSRVSRTLTVHLQTDRTCFHEWVGAERPSVKACFDRNPGLHLRLTPFGSICCDTYCEEYDGIRKNFAIFYGHADDVQCDHSQPDTDYVHITLPNEVEA